VHGFGAWQLGLMLDARVARQPLFQPREEAGSSGRDDVYRRP